MPSSAECSSTIQQDHTHVDRPLLLTTLPLELRLNIWRLSIGHLINWNEPMGPIRSLLAPSAYYDDSEYSPSCPNPAVTTTTTSVSSPSPVPLHLCDKQHHVRTSYSDEPKLPICSHISDVDNIRRRFNLLFVNTQILAEVGPLLSTTEFIADSVSCFARFSLAIGKGRCSFVRFERVAHRVRPSSAREPGWLAKRKRLAEIVAEDYYASLEWEQTSDRASDCTGTVHSIKIVARSSSDYGSSVSISTA